MSLDSLRIVDFWKVVETNDVAILDALHKYSSIYSEQQMVTLAEHWKDLYDEFYQLRNNKSGKHIFTKNTEIAKLSLMLTILTDIETRLILLNQLFGGKEIARFIAVRNEECIKDLRALYPKIRVDMFSTPIEVLTIVQSAIKSQTNILEEKVGVTEKAVEKQKQTIFDIIAIMSKILGYRLDVNTMSCMEFIGHENAINSSSKNT